MFCSLVSVRESRIAKMAFEHDGLKRKDIRLASMIRKEYIHHGKLISFPIIENGKFSHDENNITFSYAVPGYNKYIITESLNRLKT